MLSLWCKSAKRLHICQLFLKKSRTKSHFSLQDTVLLNQTNCAKQTLFTTVPPWDILWNCGIIFFLTSGFGYVAKGDFWWESSPKLIQNNQFSKRDSGVTISIECLNCFVVIILDTMPIKETNYSQIYSLSESYTCFKFCKFSTFQVCFSTGNF